MTRGGEKGLWRNRPALANTKTMSLQAIIVAAGQGSRAGGREPKQWQMLGGKPLLAWSVEAFTRYPGFEAVALVVAADRVGPAREVFRGKGVTVVAGGASRADSVRAGLRALEAEGRSQPQTFVHDAARPGLERDLITAIRDALLTHDGAAPALPVVDALKRGHDDGLRNVDRTGLHRIQTPQAFRTSLLAEALAAGGEHVDDFEAAEALGARLKLVRGHERLMKVTYSGDIPTVERLMGLAQTEFRTGQGFDVHAFEAGDQVTLCGVEIAHNAGLKGHSDADVGWHALTDAILGAACLGDIGDHFPPSDPRWADAPSESFLAHAVTLAREAGWRVTHGDITLICEAPKVKPHRDAMRASTARVLGLAADAISIKATTTEGLGFTGRREGISAMAAATLCRDARP